MKIAFIGIGVMGAPMAGHLAAAHDVVVFNRSVGKAQAWAEVHRGRVATDVVDAVRDADLVEVCLQTDADTQAVAQSALPAMKAGAIFVDHGSGTQDMALQLADQAASHGLDYLDAPITGGRIGAERGTLAVLVGGDAAVLARAEPAFRIFAADVRLMGGVGAGHVTKMVNVIIGHGNALTLAEALGFAINAGLDPTRVVDVLMQGSSRSWQLEHRSGPMIARDYRTRYPVAFARKDLSNTLAEARRTGAALPVSALADTIYAALEQRGFGAADAASIIEYFVPAGEGGDGDIDG